MKHLDEINARGYANGWHAEQLAAKASQQGRTMSAVFNDSIANASAFNVPAKCIKVTSQWITYQFSDGSTSKYVNQRRKD